METSGLWTLFHCNRQGVFTFYDFTSLFMVCFVVFCYFSFVCLFDHVFMNDLNNNNNNNNKLRFTIRGHVLHTALRPKS